MILIKKIQKIKEKIKLFKNDIFIALIIILIAVISFGLGRLSKIREEKTQIQIIEKLATENSEKSPEIKFVASKKGNKYHFPWCAGAASIKEENKIWFSSKEGAEKAGYQPASNCEGL